MLVLIFCLGSPSPNPSKWNGIARIYGRSSMAQYLFQQHTLGYKSVSTMILNLAKLPRLTFTSGIVAHSGNSGTQESESCRFELGVGYRRKGSQKTEKQTNLYPPCEHPTPPTLKPDSHQPHPFPGSLCLT